MGRGDSRGAMDGGGAAKVVDIVKPGPFDVVFLRFQACAADLDDGSGGGVPDESVTIPDLVYFLNAFEAGSPRADLDDGLQLGVQDGAVTIDDLLFFLARFEAGC